MFRKQEATAANWKFKWRNGVGTDVAPTPTTREPLDDHDFARYFLTPRHVVFPLLTPPQALVLPRLYFSIHLS